MQLRKNTLPLALLAVLTVIFFLSGCASQQASANLQVQAINTLRSQLQLPKTPLELVETAGYSNSPRGSLQVAVYQDGQGRKYYIDPLTNQVVEMDARALLENVSSLASVLTDAELRVKAHALVAASVPGFDTLLPNLNYEEGGKIDNYFYSWYGKLEAGMVSPPRIQIALHRTGLLFGWSNTLLISR